MTKRSVPSSRRQSPRHYQLIQPLEGRQLMSVSVPTAEPLITTTAAATTGTVLGLTPAQVKHAYGIDTLSFSSGKVAANGAGQTIAIVDAYADPNITADLAKFDTQFGLAAASLSVVSQTGTSVLPTANAGWAEEISLDVEWAHAIAPGAKILLVETKSSSDSDLTAGVNYARSVSGVSVVSMSWGGSEFSGETSYDSYFTTPTGHTGVTFIAASGDSGSSAGADWPASSPEVLSVGGTSLSVSGTAGTYSSETGWVDSGGGSSKYEGAPSYQSTAQTTSYRTVPDVAFDANPSTGVAVYDSYGNSTYWMEFGGTSAAAPQWGAIVAIADQGRVISGSTAMDGATTLLPTLYSLGASSSTYSADFHDVTSGSSSYAISSHTGYDEVTGLGSPKANTLVPALVASTKKVALTTKTVTTVTNRPPPPPWWMAMTTQAVVPNSEITTAGATTFAAPAEPPSFEVGTLVAESTTSAVETGAASITDGSIAVTTQVDDTVAPTTTAAGTLDYRPTVTDTTPIAAVANPMGLVGTNILSTSAGTTLGSDFTSTTSFASTLAANTWPAGSTQLRVAAQALTESFAQTLATSTAHAVKPLAVAAAAAGIVYAVAGQAKKSKKISPLFSDRTISIA